MKLFVLWDPKDGRPDDDLVGRPLSDGILGRISEDNRCLQEADFSNARRPEELLVGEWTEAWFDLFRGHFYRVYRVQ